MLARENIQELNDHLRAFPKAEDIFTKDQQWLRKHFLPLMSISRNQPRLGRTKGVYVMPF